MKNGTVKWNNDNEFIKQVTEAQPKGSIILSVKNAIHLFKDLDLNEFLSGHLDWCREQGKIYSKFEIIIGETISLTWQESSLTYL